jgi:hypothetical protein
MDKEQSKPSGDFLVIGGEMEPKGTIVKTFKIQSKDGLNFGIPIRATRKEVVDALKDNFVFLVSPDLNPQSHRSTRIKMILVSGQPFLRTDDKNLPADYIEGFNLH